MKYRIIVLLLIIKSVALIAQDQDTNLEKYWVYRERLRDQFILVSSNVEDFGTNIPANKIYRPIDEETTIDWGDANSNMSHYLSILATELWLLKNNDQEYSTTLKELYYAMLAIERLDCYSEWVLRLGDSYNNPKDIDDWFNYPFGGDDFNGFHLRDDVSNEFWEQNKHHFNVEEFLSRFENINEKYFREESSQDNIFHNLEGLSLVAKLVGEESVSAVPANFYLNEIPNRLTSIGVKNGNNIDFSLWAKDIVKRYIDYMQPETGYYETNRYVLPISTHWILHNPVSGELVEEGSGYELDLASFYHHGVIKAGEAITGENLRKYNGLVTPSNRFFDELFRSHSVEINLPDPFYDWLVDEIFGGIYIDIPFDDYKVRSLACTGNALGDETYNILIDHRDNYSYTFKGDSLPTDLIYEHFPLIYLTLQDDKNELMPISGSIYRQDKSFYEDLLNKAPICGNFSDGGVYEWSSTSRCVWPEGLGANSETTIEYSGLDYMMLHNLYYIAFRRQEFDRIDVSASDVGSSLYTGVINASLPITTGNNIVYEASNKVVLSPGFSVDGERNFKAIIDRPVDSYFANQYKVVDPNICNIESRSAMLNTSESIVDDSNSLAAFAQLLEKKKQQDLDINNSICSEISVYPNPAKDYCCIDIGDGNYPVQVIIYSANGMEMLCQKIVYEGNRLDLSSLVNGIYLLAIDYKHTRKYQKLSIMR